MQGLLFGKTAFHKSTCCEQRPLVAGSGFVCCSARFALSRSLLHVFVKSCVAALGAYISHFIPQCDDTCLLFSIWCITLELSNLRHHPPGSLLISKSLISVKLAVRAIDTINFLHTSMLTSKSPPRERRHCAYYIQNRHNSCDVESAVTSMSATCRKSEFVTEIKGNLLNLGLNVLN